jgi:hypothetical protein
MKAKQQYRLQALLDVRERSLEDARKALSCAMDEVFAAQKAVDRSRDKMKKKKSEIAEMSRHLEFSRLRAQDLLLRASKLEALKKDLLNLEIELNRAVETHQETQKKEAKAAALVREAQGELKVLQKHKEKWEHEKKKCEEKRAEEIMEEAAATSSWRKEFEQ